MARMLNIGNPSERRNQLEQESMRSVLYRLKDMSHGFGITELFIVFKLFAEPCQS
jgi:hypothetical protein